MDLREALRAPARLSANPHYYDKGRGTSASGHGTTQATSMSVPPHDTVLGASIAEVLFSADPTTASERVFEALAAEIPYSRLTQSELGDTFRLLVGAQLASSNGDARRSLSAGAYYVNGAAIDENSDIAASELLHGRYLLLRKGKKTHHLMEISS